MAASGVPIGLRVLGTTHLRANKNNPVCLVDFKAISCNRSYCNRS